MNKEKIHKAFDKIFKRFGYFMLILGIWANGFMFGAIERIIEGTSRSDFNIHFIITFIIIFGGINFIRISNGKGVIKK